MLTEAQNTIIQEVCSIQFESLEDILISIDLGEDEEGDRYEDIFIELGIERKDFDEKLVETIDNFQWVHSDPERIFKLEELDLMVFRHILHNFRHRWESKFPKALSNLWNKLFIWNISNELYNKQ